MPDAEIEMQISRIELTNMMTAELRKRDPESYRLALRISTAIQKRKSFKRFDGQNNPDNFCRLANRLYGLTEWSNNKMQRNNQEMEDRVKTVSIYNRDTTFKGCTGDSQVIITNFELEKLIIRVFKAIDSPIDVRSLRSLVMSRLSILDIYLVPISNTGDNALPDYDFADTNPNPEEDILRHEAELEAAEFVVSFLRNLEMSVRDKSKQYNRLIHVLWYCYLTGDSKSQLEIADLLGVSDSLVYDDRKRIESNLQKIPFYNVQEVRLFEEVLRRKVCEIVTIEEVFV
jgi:hypothetical protein